MKHLSHTFAALSDETRFAVVERLMAEGELPVSALLEATSISAPALSRHLKVLRKAGLVAQRADGTRRLYSVRPEAMKAVADWAIAYRDFWEAGMDRLEAMLALEEDEEK